MGSGPIWIQTNGCLRCCYRLPFPTCLHQGRPEGDKRCGIFRGEARPFRQCESRGVSPSHVECGKAQQTMRPHVIGIDRERLLDAGKGGNRSPPAKANSSNKPERNPQSLNHTADRPGSISPYLALGLSQEPPDFEAIRMLFQNACANIMRIAGLPLRQGTPRLGDMCLDAHVQHGNRDGHSNSGVVLKREAIRHNGL